MTLSRQGVDYTLEIILKLFLVQAGSKFAQSQSMSTVTKELWKSEGIRGLYRGGLPLFIGGALQRSAQFGVNDIALKFIRSFRENHHKPLKKEERLLGIIDYEVIFGGFCGGIGRGLVEAPFEFMKVRRQVDREWRFKDIYKGSGITIFRNSFLFMFFMFYIDIGNQIVPGGLTPFMTGGICANLAWLTIWPLDVVKSQLQSGNFSQQSVSTLLKISFQNGTMYRGLLPGLTRSFIANGCSMVVLVETKKRLEELNKK